MDMMPTLSFRWLVRTDPDSGSPVRVLQQLFVSMDRWDCNDWDKDEPEWRDVPEVVEGGE